MVCMTVFDEKREELERHELQYGLARGRLAVTLDLLTDALILAGQHGVYCRSARNPAQPTADVKTILDSLTGAKELVQSVMEELKKK